MKHEQRLLYYLNWIVIGLFFGVLYLLISGQGRLTLLGLSIGHNDASAEDRADTTSFASAVAVASPTVVSIRSLRFVDASVNPKSDPPLDHFLGKIVPQAPKIETRVNSGSGVIVDAKGYVLTNYHVIADTDNLQVTLTDGRTVQARLVGKDPDTDLAVLKIDLKNLPQARIGDIKKVRIGDVVMAIGYPFEIGQTVTQGIISATGRSRVSSNTYENFLQTDAAINPGNSGGALINAAGEIIGINSLIYTKTGNFQGIGFAIPIDLAINVLKQITSNGYVVRGWLGVEGQDILPASLDRIGLSNVQGILVTSVDANGPGDKAGLKPGDIITHINQQPIKGTSDIVKIVAAGKPGDLFTIDGLRQRESFSLQATLGQRPLRSE
jgi:Do/DeqQ family serine protease